MSTHWKKQHNYDYMGSYSLPDGKDIIVTIESTRRELVTGTAGKKQECFTVKFKESDKPMILNRTNCKAIEKVLKTPYIEDWIGKRIQIGIDTVSAFGESVDALRVRPIAPVVKTKVPLRPSDEKWGEAVKFIQSGGKMETLLGRYIISEEDQLTLTQPAQ